MADIRRAGLRCGDTNTVTSSVASRPTMWAIALSPPGWYFSQPSTFNTCWSTMITERPSAINASTSLRETNGYDFVLLPSSCFCWGAEGAISTGGIGSWFRRLCRRPIEAELGNWFTEASGGERWRILYRRICGRNWSARAPHRIFVGWYGGFWYDPRLQRMQQQGELTYTQWGRSGWGIT